MNTLVTGLAVALLTGICCFSVFADETTVYPKAAWEVRTPEQLGVDAAKLDKVARELGGRGCVIKDGYIVKQWRDQAQLGDWLSSAKPVISTLLFFAIEEGLVKSVDEPIADFGWKLKPRHQDITFRHLGAMSSGYARPEGAGEAWSYNDYAIQLYQKTLFGKVFKAHGNEVAASPKRLGPLNFQDGLWFGPNHRLSASVRDFSRLAWFWCHKGNWAGRQLLPRHYFDDYMRPQTPKDLPQSVHDGKDDDYLGIGSYGGGSNHFSEQGPGIYGFNWWFNDTGRLHPDALTWPDAPKDLVMSIGAGGNSSAFSPSLNAALICAQGNWGAVEGGKRDSQMNQALGLFSQACGYDPKAPCVTGSREKWLPLTIDFSGPKAKAADTAPNPFLDYRLQVAFKAPSGATREVPGFFAGDGEGGLSGNVWRVVFSPDETGDWQFRAVFRKGKAVAVSLDKDAGEATAFDGAEGHFTVTEQKEPAPGFYRWGRLAYVGKHYLKFADCPYWIKGGTDSPEDFLAYAGFVNTPRAGHTYANHVRDWREGDPDWDEGKGKGIIGALNYLASAGVNSLYLLPMNIGGDGRNVHPYLGSIDGKGSPKNDNLHFDLAKLHQWGIVFEHAQRKGIMLHVVLNEAEEPNKRELDDGQLGVERKLYYREMAARFGHYPALQWNLCEEYNIVFPLAPNLVKDYARYLRAMDPYEHPITVHHAGDVDKAWAPFLGDPFFMVTSFQVNKIDVVERWRKKSRDAGRPLVIGMDEFFPDTARAEDADRLRKEYTWPIYLSGGGLEYILATLLQTDDFRVYDALWRDLTHARRFLEENLPFWEMTPADHLLTGAAEYQGKNNIVTGQVFARENVCYVVYLPSTERTGALNLASAKGAFEQRWFNPRTGRFEGKAARIQGGGEVPLGSPPGEPGEDWAMLITRAVK